MTAVVADSLMAVSTSLPQKPILCPVAYHHTATGAGHSSIGDSAVELSRRPEITAPVVALKSALW